MYNIDRRIKQDRIKPNNILVPKNTSSIISLNPTNKPYFSNGLFFFTLKLVRFLCQKINKHDFCSKQCNLRYINNNWITTYYTTYRDTANMSFMRICSLIYFEYSEIKICTYVYKIFIDEMSSMFLRGLHLKYYNNIIILYLREHNIWLHCILLLPH